MRTLSVWLFIGFAAAGWAARADELTVKEMGAARSMYVGKCAKCHEFYEPTKYSESDWQTWMRKMRKKSKLKEEQAVLLNRYLQAYRAGRLPGKPQEQLKSAQGASVDR